MATSVNPPGSGMPPVNALSNMTPEDTLNIRDAMSAFIGKGYSGTQNDDSRALYNYMRGRLGNDVAQKLLMHLSIFNQRPDLAKLSPQQKVERFYSIGSNDPALDILIKRSGMLSRGPVAGFMDSPNVLAKDVNKDPDFIATNTTPFSAPGSLQTIKKAASSLK